jgi:mitochondrial enoyl-[acyl-carrier protein] reductase / trans-2-enoyl-CoA reductase
MENIKEGKSLLFSICGNPSKVLELNDYKTRKLFDGEVLIRMLASPIIPADLNYINGFYGRQPLKNGEKSKSGMEGVGIIEASRAKDLKIGSKVIILQGTGTWSDYLILPSEFVLTIGDHLSLYQSAMLKINPMTALRLLVDFTKLMPGDWIIQNASNSGVGESIIQLAKIMGFRTINFVRKKNEREVKLYGLGADLVIEDGDPNGFKIIEEITQQQKPKLGINAVGGNSANQILNLLAHGGKLVTYGGLSMKNIQVNATQLIFKNISLHGFWLSEWLKSKNILEISEEYDKLISLINEGKLKLSVDSIFNLSDYQNAINRAQAEYRNGKVIFDFTKLME